MEKGPSIVDTTTMVRDQDIRKQDSSSPVLEGDSPAELNFNAYKNLSASNFLVFLKTLICLIRCALKCSKALVLIGANNSGVDWS